MRFIWIAGAVASAALMALSGCENQDKTGATQPGTTAREGNRDDTAAGRGWGLGASLEAMQAARGVAMVRLLSEGEIEAGRLAADRASSAEVKAFAKKLVDDHTQLLQRSDQIASTKKLDLTAARSDMVLRAYEAESRQSIDRLKGVSGQAFDVQFIAMQAGKHMLLAAIADAGEQASQDGDIDGLFKAARDQARDHGAQAQAILPRECGGQGMTALVVVVAEPAQAGQPGQADQAGQPGQPGQAGQPEAGQRGGRAETREQGAGRTRSGTGSTPPGAPTGAGTQSPP